MKEYFKVLVVGSSGKGKSYMARTLDPKTTAIINPEDQPMPFKEGKLFEFHTRPRTYQEVYSDLVRAAKDPNIKTIFLDSFSGFSDLVLKEAKSTKKGFDIWSMYNEEIGKLLTLIKKIEKDIFITAHYEVLNVDGGAEKRVKVKAKEWEGLTIVTQTISPCKNYLIAGTSLSSSNYKVIMKYG